MYSVLKNEKAELLWHSNGKTPADACTKTHIYKCLPHSNKMKIVWMLSHLNTIKHVTNNWEQIDNMEDIYSINIKWKIILLNNIYKKLNIHISIHLIKH